MNTIFETLFNLDLNIVIWVQQSLQSPLWTPFWILVTTIGNSGAIWILVSLGLILYPKTRHIGITCALSLVFSLIIVNIGLKNVVARPRPYTYFDASLLIKEPHDFSFPSGHTSASFAAAVVLYKERLKLNKIPVYTIAMTLAIVMSLSRLYLSVHFPSDILGGALTGILSASLAMFAGHKFLRGRV